MDGDCDRVIQASEEEKSNRVPLELVKTDTENVHEDADLQTQFEKIHDRIKNTLSLIEEATKHVKSITFAQEYAYLKNLQETDFTESLETESENRPTEEVVDNSDESKETVTALDKDVEKLQNTIEDTLLQMI